MVTQRNPNISVRLSVFHGVFTDTTLGAPANRFFLDCKKCSRLAGTMYYLYWYLRSLASSTLTVSLDIEGLKHTESRSSEPLSPTEFLRKEMRKWTFHAVLVVPNIFWNIHGHLDLAWFLKVQIFKTTENLANYLMLSVDVNVVYFQLKGNRYSWNNKKMIRHPLTNKYKQRCILYYLWPSKDQ